MTRLQSLKFSFFGWLSSGTGMQWVLLCFRIQFFAASSSAVVAMAANQQAVFEIDAQARGASLIYAFNHLSAQINAGNKVTGINTSTPTYVPWAGIQTSLPAILGNTYGTYNQIKNGFIPYVQNIQSTPNNTLLIVTYLPPTKQSLIQYIILPVEQVVDLLYFPTTNNVPNFSMLPFTSVAPYNYLFFYSIPPAQRALDIVYAVNWLNATNVKNYLPNSSQVWIQTTIGGPYTPAINGTNSLPGSGLLRNVQSISLQSTDLLQITFLQQPTQNNNQVVYVSPEQVQWVIFVRNYTHPSAL